MLVSTSRFSSLTLYPSPLCFSLPPIKANDGQACQVLLAPTHSCAPTVFKPSTSVSKGNFDIKFMYF